MTQSNSSNGNHYRQPPSNYSSRTNGSISPNGIEESKSDTNQFEFDIRMVWSMLARYKFAILLIILLTTLGFGLIAYTLDPVYESEGSILISESKAYNPPQGNSISAMLSNMYGIGRENKVSDELQILQSRSLSMEIAKKLLENPLMENGKKYPVLWRKFPEDGTNTTPDTVAQRIRKNISFSQAEKSNLITISYKSRSPYEAAKMVNLTMDTYTDFSSHQNRMSARSAVQFLQEEKKRIQDNLKTAEQGLRNFMNKEQLIELDVQTNELIKDIANLESEKQSLQAKLVATNSAIEQYEERLKNLKPQLVRRYTDAVLPKLDRFQYQLAELETEKMLMISRNPDLKDHPNPPEEFQQLNKKIADLKNDIHHMTEKLVAQSGDFTGNLGSTSEDVAGNITDIHNEVIKLRVEKNQLQAQQEVIDERLNEEQAFFKELPNNMIELARLKREVEINEQLYRTVSEQHAEMKLWEQTRFGVGRPIDFGYVPEKPDGSNQVLYLIAGLLLGGILGLCYTCMKEFSNSTINRLGQIRKYNIPTLGLIPDMENYATENYGDKNYASWRKTEVSTKLPTLLNSYSTEAEAFRRISNNVLYARPSEKLQTIMTTSYGIGEGESEVSANLAVTFSEVGRKVLMVDTDFRQPFLHTMFGLNKSPGITEILSGEVARNDAIQQTSVPKLNLLTPGREPSNPKLINQSNALHDLIDNLKETYDHLILKTTPFGILTDATPLIPLTDGVIVIGKFDKTREDEFGELIHNLQDVNAPILGAVLTAFAHKKSLDYYTGYSRSYRRAYEDYFSNQHKNNNSETRKAIKV